MKDSLSTQQCGEIIADLAELLPTVLKPQVEDILAVIDGREELGEELSYAANDVRGFVSQSCRTLMADRRFTECLPQIVPDDQREEVVSKRLQRMGAMR